MWNTNVSHFPFVYEFITFFSQCEYFSTLKTKTFNLFIKKPFAEFWIYRLFVSFEFERWWLGAWCKHLNLSSNFKFSFDFSKKSSVYQITEQIHHLAVSLKEKVKGARETLKEDGKNPKVSPLHKRFSIKLCNSSQTNLIWGMYL